MAGITALLHRLRGKNPEYKKHGTDIDRDRYFLYKVCFRYLNNVSLNTLYRIIRDRLLQADTDRQASKKQEMAH